MSLKDEEKLEPRCDFSKAYFKHKTNIYSKSLDANVLITQTS